MPVSKDEYLESTSLVTRRAIELISELNHDICARCRHVIPTAGLHLDPFRLQITIGDVSVWSSHENNEDDLTVEFCLNRYVFETRYAAEPWAMYDLPDRYH